VLSGPSLAPPPVLPQPPPATLEEPSPEPPVVRQVVRDADETRAETGYGSSYEAPFGGRVEERYDGSVGVSISDPGRAWARAATKYRIEWPEATVTTEARLDLRSDAETYHVTIDVVAREEGEDGIGRIARRFERTIPRRLQ